MDARGLSLGRQHHPPGFFALNSRELRQWMVARLNADAKVHPGDHSKPVGPAAVVSAAASAAAHPPSAKQPTSTPLDPKTRAHTPGFWDKFDVKTYWPHSHAAIVARTKRSPGSEDVAQFLVDTYFAPAGTVTLGAPKVGIPAYTPPDIVTPAEAISPQV